jgi:DNA-directed RNA polymerase specialized sigma24 family protein
MSEKPPLLRLSGELSIADCRAERTVHRPRENFVHIEFHRERELKDATPESLYLNDSMRSYLQAAVDQLPPKPRMAFTLVEIENQTIGEAAGRMGLSEEVVYQLVNRAYGQMARAMKGRRWRE